ncbi:hypothetical protein EMCRGX_G016992 [Ephydatia muelleri]
MAAIQQQQQAQPYRYEPTLSTLNAGRQELLLLPSNEAAPSGRIKYEFGMKNENYRNNCARCPSCHLLLTKRIRLYTRQPGLIPKDNQVPKEQIPKADTFECSAAVHWQEAEKGKIPMYNPFPLYPKTADEVNIHNKRLSNGYEVKKKNEEKRRPLVNIFSNLTAAVAAPLNRIMSEADGPMVIAELEEQLPGTLDRWGASDQNQG